MAKAILTGKVNLSSSIPVESTLDQWDISLIFTDGEGAFQANAVSIGDALFLDTSGYELATISRYIILSIASYDDLSGLVNCRIQFADNNNDPIDPAYCLGTDGAIGKLTESHKYNIVPAPGAQALSDRFAIYPRDADFYQRLDNIVLKLFAESFTAGPGGIIKGRAVCKSDASHVILADNSSQANTSVIGIALETVSQDGITSIFKHTTVPAGTIIASCFTEASLPSDGTWVFLSNTSGKLTVSAPLAMSGLWQTFLGIWNNGTLELQYGQWGQA